MEMLYSMKEVDRDSNYRETIALPGRDQQSNSPNIQQISGVLNDNYKL